MRLATRLTALLLCCAASTAVASEPLRPNSLLNWLRIIDSDEFRLLCASDQNGHFVAVKVDSDGDVLFCDYNHSDESKTNPRSFSLAVRDSKDEDLHNLDSKKKSPKTIEIEYSAISKVGLVKTTSSVTVAYSAGVIYPLRKHRLATLRVRYIEDLQDGSKRVIFDRVVHMPKKAG